MDWSKVRVVVTGGAGFLGTFVCEKLRQRGCRNVQVPRSRQYDLTREDAVERMFVDMQPDVVIHLAAEVGGIGANLENPGRFFYANMSMGMHLVEHARRCNIRKFVQAGTVCAYPKITPVPFKEDDLWNGYPEETNAPYGVAKKSIFVMLDAYKRQYGLNGAVAVPVNLYGPKDNFSLRLSHVIPALIRKCVEAKQTRQNSISVWGTGSASREFLYVEDAAEGIVRVAEVMDDPQPINLGTGQEIKVRHLVELIATLTGFKGEIIWDDSKPDGQPRRCLDTSTARNLLNWKAEMDLEEGLRRTIEWWLCDGHRRNAA